jgi:hypothetical protein
MHRRNFIKNGVVFGGALASLGPLQVYGATQTTSDLKESIIMPNLEILLYSPINMDSFIDFCINGKNDANGKPLKDEHDREMTGIFAWLHGREVPMARFFSSGPHDPVQLFMAIIQPVEDEPRPWFSIPGFKGLVREDGTIGYAPASAMSARSRMTDNPLDFVKPRHDLDQLFIDQKKKGS